VLETEPAVVQLGNGTRNGKTQTRSAKPTRAQARFVGAKESFKDAGLKFSGNAASGVGDRNLVAGVNLMEPHFYRSALRGEFDGIVEKVGNHLP